METETTSTKPIDKATLLNAIRADSKAAGGRHIGMNKFLADHSFKLSDLYRHFSGWRSALRAAGVCTSPRNAPVDDDTLLCDWAAVAARIRRIPSWNEYKVRGKHTLSTFTRRFGSWNAIPGAFRAYAARRPRWKKLLKTLSESPSKRRFRPSPELKGRPRLHPKTATPFRDRPACGVPLDFGPLRHAPVNETGVIALFILLAERLGFMIDGFQTAFPDCLAKRLTGAGRWQPVTIEFEYESRGYLYHRHPPRGCDIIVCWEHNWEECPDHLEVIALSEELKRLTP